MNALQKLKLDRVITQGKINEIKKYHVYADGGAYMQDDQRLDELAKQLKDINAQIEKIDTEKRKTSLSVQSDRIQMLKYQLNILFPDYKEGMTLERGLKVLAILNEAQKELQEELEKCSHTSDQS